MLAGAAIVYLLAFHSTASNTLAITVSDKACAPSWHAPPSGQSTFELRNLTNEPYEVDLVGADQQTVYGRVELLGPHTQRPLPVALPPGRFSWRCDAASGVFTLSATATVHGPPVAAKPYVPATSDEIAASVAAYRTSITTGMAALVTKTDRLRVAVSSGRLGIARIDWLDAHTQYERLGAAYGTFGDLDGEINGRADGLPGGIRDPHFTGFLRLEYGLWHKQPVSTLTPFVVKLDVDVRALVKQFPTMQTAPNDVALRTHEILENTLQFELTGRTDEGSHTNLATARANVDGTESALAAISPLLQTRDAALLERATDGLRDFATMLDRLDRGGVWSPLTSLTQGQREQLDSDVSGLLEQLDPIPDILAIDRDSD